MNASSSPASYAPVLPASVSLGAVTLRTRDLDRLARFYGDVLGLKVLAAEDGRSTLGAGSNPLVVLEEDKAAPLAPERAPGLFHLAIRVPDAAALAKRVLALHAHGVPFGAADHLVSEAIYVDDPDGNGVEIYRDRPADAWRWSGGEIEMATLPLDLRTLMAALPAGAASPGGLPEGTDMGHVHLKVSDLGRARRFWVDAMGFGATTTSYPGALFVSAGGYHHHLGLNTWRSRGAAAPPEGAAGLAGFVLHLPAAGLPVLARRLAAAGIATTPENGGFSARDPDGTRVAVRPAG